MEIPSEDQTLDLAGVGVGPFNMSVAALIEPLQEFKALFFERHERFTWHPGLLIPEGSIQVSFLKDPVTLADPTSKYSFLSYMHQKRRMYRFINAGFPKIKRFEFDLYFKWVCESLSNLRFGCPVESVELEDDRLMVGLGDRRVGARNVILGTGLVPNVPDCARPYLGPKVFHAAQYLLKDLKTKGQRIAVVGGGQSGAELVNHMISVEPDLPEHVTWVARRANFLPLDATPFVEEHFTPAYSDYFFNLPEDIRKRLIGQQRFASDGINGELLAQIYRRFYELEFLEGAGRMFSLHIASEMLDMRPKGEGWELDMLDRVTGERFGIEADVVILATGFKFRVPPCLEPLKSRISLVDDQFFPMREDYSIIWDGPESLRIYAQNAARHCRGVPDPNLSLMAWRSATIINSLLGRTIYDVAEASSAFDWQGVGVREPVLQGT